MTYITIEGTNYQVDSLEQIETAEASMREAGIKEADVFTSPLSFDELESGELDNDGYPNGQKLFA